MRRGASGQQRLHALTVAILSCHEQRESDTLRLHLVRRGASGQQRLHTLGLTELSLNATSDAWPMLTAKEVMKEPLHSQCPRRLQWGAGDLSSGSRIHG